MKYGVIMYKNSENLGDDIQTYAAMQYLPQVDYFIDRESMDTFVPAEPEMVKVILNGWYLYDHLAWPPSDFIHPLITSVHFDTKGRLYGGRNIEQNHVLGYSGADFLREFGPIGCRDYPTYELLQKNNIDSYFSSCLTLTIKPFADVAKTDEILLVDICWDDRLEPVREAIKKAANLPARVMTHYSPRPMLEQMDSKTRMVFVESRLKAYQSARCVVTTRLHCALPCLALGTPVLLIKEDGTQNRLDTFYPFFEHATLDELKNGKFTDFFFNPEKPKTGWEDIANAMRMKCMDFVNSAIGISIPPLETIIMRHNKRVSAVKSILDEVVRNMDQIKKEFDETSRLLKDEKGSHERTAHALKSLLNDYKDEKDSHELTTQALKNFQAKYNEAITSKHDYEIRLNNAQIELDAMRNSTFWKFTKPFRKIMDIIRGRGLR